MLLVLHLHFAGWCITACCTRMQGDMQCSLTCRRVCVCAVESTGVYYCCRRPLRLQYACLLKVIWWCKDSVHLPSLGNVSCRCVCVSMLLSGYVKCNVGFFIPCLMSWQSVILKVKRDRMIHQNNACLAVSLPQGGCAWLQYPFQQCVPLDCCIWEMNELHSSEKHPTYCITSILLKHC